MSRKIVRVNVPRSQPDRLIELAGKILAQHEADGAKSPLAAERMSTLQELVKEARSLNSKAADLAAQASGTRHRRDQVLGIADGQTSGNVNTLLNLVKYARVQLGIHFEGHEQSMETYGFNVVVGSAKSPRRGAGQQGGVAA